MYPLLPLYFPLCAAFFFMPCGSRAVEDCSGKSYEHRRGWVEHRLLFLSSVFAIDLCAYAIMSNHVHVKQTQVWSDNDVVQSWHRLHKGRLLTQMFIRGDNQSQAQKLTLDDTITEYRRRLHDISCLMRNLNKYIVRESIKLI